jgi:signal transduction histidine kinase
VGKAEPGRILLRAERRDGSLHLVVEDDGVGLPPSWNGNGRGFGLKNVRERLRALYGERARLEIANGAEVGVTVAITLPFRDA